MFNFLKYYMIENTVLNNIHPPIYLHVCLFVVD